MGKAKLEQTLKAKLADGEKLFVPYIMAGDGGLDQLNNQISLLAKAGASAIELGIPFSDPVADGPTIQAAGLRSLQNGTTLKGILDTLNETASRAVPIVLMTYVNPIFRYGIAAFFADAQAAGVDGVIIPDLPMEEETLVHEDAAKHGIALIRLAAMTSTADRIEAIAKRSEGFLYAVSVTGTTGARAQHADNVDVYLERLKNLSPVPVLAGFGVSSAEQAKELGSHCDGVIVGSAIVNLFHENKTAEIEKLIQESVRPLDTHSI